MKFLIICLIFLSVTIEAKLKIEISQGSKDLAKIAKTARNQITRITQSVSYTHLTLPTTPYV